MNREETKQAIEVMQASLDGAEIEGRMRPGFVDYKGGWRLKVLGRWDWHSYVYRVKPKPREWLAYVLQNGSLHTIIDASEQEKEIVKVREVIE